AVYYCARSPIYDGRG
nr:immunoglobulin heavy chain junction region [Mus musculus]